MLPRADLNNSTRPLAAIEAPTPVESAGNARQEIYHRLSQIALGKQLQADVVSLLEDGSFLVKVADTAARMALPPGTRVGDRIPMALVAREPRPTFLLTPQEGSAPASLSTTGRLIDHVLQVARQHQAPTAIASDTPLMPGQLQDINPEKLAQTMHENLEFSGIFYESHLQQWLAGSRPQSLLTREPQAQGGPYIQHDAPPVMREGSNTGTGTPSAGEAGDTTEGARRLLQLAQAMRERPDYAATVSATDADLLTPQLAGSPDVAPEAARMISLQLNALEQQQVQWQGELWPGQRLEWSVSQDAPGNPARDSAEPSWTSTVRFRLPILGEIAATVRLTGGHVQISVNTPDAMTVQTLRSHVPLLSDALAAAGSPLDVLLVKKDESA